MAPQDRIRKFPLHPGEGHDPRRVRRAKLTGYEFRVAAFGGQPTWWDMAHPTTTTQEVQE